MRVITGIQPSGTITIGNYLGAIKNLEKQIKDNDEVFIFIADQHALTVGPDPKELNANIKSLISLYIAMGMDKKASIFCQSQVPAHSELCWILQCQAKVGELNRMTQFKDKSQKHVNPSVGLFTYPTLMAADILLYNADCVPVGEDQKQHLELTRDLAEKFNSFYNEEFFKLPEPLINKGSAKIYSLVDPTKKMSKSDENSKAFISILDTPKTIEKKIKSATTDSVGVINYDLENQPGVTNLLNIYKEIEGKTTEEVMEHFEGQNYGFLKSEVANSIIEALEPIQRRYVEVMKDEDLIKEVLISGAKQAQNVSQENIKKIKEMVGYFNI